MLKTYTMSLPLNCNPVDLDQEQVLDYLSYLKTCSKAPSSSYFKYTVYGLSFSYKITCVDGKGIQPSYFEVPKETPCSTE